MGSTSYVRLKSRIFMVAIYLEIPLIYRKQSLYKLTLLIKNFI